MPTGSEIRETFLRFFESKGHRRVHSSSLVPANDPTLLFTNAGMNQFKDVFLGLEKRDYSRATTSQKCVRAGGKHNDLENVGFTKRHHTFFEMLGNFSFGDYFKRDAIAYAWELVTSKQWYGIAKEKLYCTIFAGEQGIPRDDEAEKFWVGVGVPKDRVFALGMKDNFWAMADTGPCGPCSEIHYDMGPAASEQGHANCKFPCECGRYVEFWNLVFMQFDRDASGTYNPLPKPSVDTGMGLERVASILQGVLSNYETDLFTPLIETAAKVTGADLKRELAAEQGRSSAASLRVIADHARATTFLISDGVLPANEGRGYVLRKILRRGIRHGRLLGAEKPFMYEMVHAVRDMMKGAYPELVESAERVSKVVYEEERRFAHTLDIGLKHLEERFGKAKGIELRSLERYLEQFEAEGNIYLDRKLKDLEAEKILAATSDQEIMKIGDEILGNGMGISLLEFIKSKGLKNPVLKGEDAFKLYDTYGLPLDFIEDAARDRGIFFDHDGFAKEMFRQRERARSSWKGGAKQSASPAFQALQTRKNPYLTISVGVAPDPVRFPESFNLLFEGYKSLEVRDAQILAIIINGSPVLDLQRNQKGDVVLDRTPFYAESGGQVGDVGLFYDENHNTIVADVSGCTMPVQGVRVHKVVAREPIHVGMKVDAMVHADVRQATMRNHTATHLLHAGLREVLGKHVKQAGSLVDPGHLRFDFSHFTGVADEELQDIEDIINKEVLKNTRVETIEDVPIDVAVNEYKAMALFGEKYGERVRVIRIGDFSTELCGGTHTTATGEIGLIKILDEGSVSSGVRRVEAVSGAGSLLHFRKDHQLESVVATLVPQAQKAGSPAEALRAELEKREAEIKRLQKELEQMRMKSAASTIASVDEKVRSISGIKVLPHRVDNLERDQMRVLVDNLRNKIGSGVVVLGSAQDGKVALVVGVTKDLTSRLQAGKVIKPLAEKVGGSGGGRPDMAEAGGKDPANLDSALNDAYDVVKGMIDGQTHSSVKPTVKMATMFLSPEFFGGSLATLGQFSEQCGKFARDQLIYACSILNCVLKDLTSPIPDVNAHEAIVRTLFVPTIADQIVQLSKSENHARFIFHRRQLLNVIKEAACVSGSEGLNPFEPRNNPELVKLLLMANDQLYKESKADLPAKILQNMIPVLEYSSGILPNKIARTYFLLSKFLKESSQSRQYIDVPGLFASSTGLSLDMYQYLTAGTLFKYMQYSLNDFKQNNRSFFIDESFFKNVNVEQTSVQQFLNDMGADTSHIRSQMAQRDFGIDDLTAFRRYPIYREAHAYAVDAFFVVDKLESGPFWRAHEALNDQGRKQLHAFWGTLFESYLLWVLESYIDGRKNVLVRNPKVKSINAEIIDGIVQCGDSLVLIEAKGSTFTARAKYGSDPEVLKKEIRDKLVIDQQERKGVSQLANAIKSLHHSGFADFSGIRRIFPLLITRDEIGSAFYLNAFLQAEFEKMLPSAGNIEVYPLVCMSASDFEQLAPLLGGVSLAEVLEARIKAEPALKLSFPSAVGKALKGQPRVDNRIAKEGMRLFFTGMAEHLFPGQTLGSL